MDQAGSQKSGRIRSWGRVGSDSRSSWERDGSLDPYSAGASDPQGPSSRDSPAGNALASPGPFTRARGGITCTNRDLAGRCPSRNGFSVDERFSWTQGGEVDARGGFGTGQVCVRGAVRRCREVDARGGFSEGWDAPLPGRATAVTTASLLMMGAKRARSPPGGI